MSIWVIINTFKSDDVIRKPENAILVFWWCHTTYDVFMMSVSFQQLRHITIQQIKPPNKSFNLNREIFCTLWLKSIKIVSTLL